MSLHGFQQALSELVLSPDLRSKVADEGAEALDAFDLDARETRRVMAVAQHPGLSTGVLIHRSFRLSMITETLPRTCTVLGEDLGDVVHDFWQEHLPLNLQFLREALRFAGWVRQLQAAGRLTDVYLPGALRLDLAALAVRRKLTPEEVTLRADDLVAPPEDDRLVVVLEHEPTAVLEALEAGRRPDAPGGTFQMAVCRLSVGTVRLEPVTETAEYG